MRKAKKAGVTIVFAFVMSLMCVTASAGTKRYIVTSNHHYKTGVSTAGSWKSLNNAKKGLNKQPYQGEWYIYDTQEKEIVMPELNTRKEKLDKVVLWAVSMAQDPNHGYSCEGELTPNGQGLALTNNRWGKAGDYSCSTLVATAYDLFCGISFREICAENGYTIPVPGYGSQVGYSSKNIIKAIKKSGKFKDVSSSLRKKGAAALKPGDILVKKDKSHVVMVVGANAIVEATSNEQGQEYTKSKPGDQTGHEIHVRGYYDGFYYAYRLKS